MDPRVDMIVSAVEKMDAKLDDIQVKTAENTLVLKANTADIEKHIRRSDTLEDSVEAVIATLLGVKIFCALTIGVVAIGTFFSYFAPLFKIPGK